MTIDIEQQLVAGMREQVAGVRLSTDVLAAAARRHQRRVAVHRTTYAAGVLGLAGMLAAAVAIGAAGGSAPEAGGTDRPSVPGAGPASIELAAAIAASERISYRLKITIGGSKTDPDGWGTMEGAFDPATATGYLNRSEPNNPTVYYQRLINGKIYFSSSGQRHWKQEPGNGNFEYGDAFGGVAGSTVDPKELFEALRQAGANITDTGAGRYHFEVALDAGSASPSPYPNPSRMVVGDVTLNADHRIAKVSFEETTTGRGENGEEDTSTIVLAIQFSAYGVPVRVETPTDVVVAK